MKLSEVLAQETVELTVGDYLASVTRSEGYVPTYRDTDSVHKGQYLYKIVGIGEPDVDGNYSEIRVIPVIKSEDGKSFIDDEENPVVIQNGSTIHHMTGRNHPDFKDAYNGRQFHKVENVAEGEEHRHVLAAFITFVNSEFSMGVNDFQLADPEMIEQA